LSVAGEASPAIPFGDRLAQAVSARESQIVLGIDPDPAKLWPDAVGALAESRARLVLALADVERSAALDIGQGDRAARLDAGAAVLGHCLALIDAAGPACVAVKPQFACFERLGFPGWLALEATIAHARAQGLLVIADAKRGDISGSAAAYAQAVFGGLDTPFGPSQGLAADAVTQNPLLGRDALAPFLDGARAHGAGVFVLVRTSNPSATDFFDAELVGGGPLWERIAGLVAELGTPGSASGLAEVGAVTGATVPQHLARMRELMPHAPFLLPGIGAQGGRVADLAPAFAPGPAAGLVTASRSIANAHEADGGDPGAAARAEAERLRAQAWALA
jgi:orotidine-5'-phosphate decarboxylase